MDPKNLDPKNLDPKNLDLRNPCHIGVATNDIDHAIVQLGAQFGLSFESPRAPAYAFATPAGPVPWRMRVAHSTSGLMEIELLEGSPGSIWHTERATVLHHYAYWSDEFETEIDALVASGWELELTLSTDDRRPSAFAYLAKPNEPRIEVIARNR